MERPLQSVTFISRTTGPASQFWFEGSNVRVHLSLTPKVAPGFTGGAPTLGLGGSRGSRLAW